MVVDKNHWGANLVDCPRVLLFIATTLSNMNRVLYNILHLFDGFVELPKYA